MGFGWFYAEINGGERVRGWLEVDGGTLMSDDLVELEGTAYIHGVGTSRFTVELDGIDDRITLRMGDRDHELEFTGAVRIVVLPRGIGGKRHARPLYFSI